jgi:spore maturation protein CgeB
MSILDIFTKKAKEDGYKVLYFDSLKQIERYKKLERILKEDEWIEVAKEKPPHDVVLAVCDTYDCGWVMDTVWWYEDKQCWMTTGSVKNEPAHLPYTHWKRLPKPPKNIREEKLKRILK